MNDTNLKIKIKDLIASIYDNVLKDILNHKHTHYVLKGGRGSLKSSFVGIVIPLLIISNPLCHAVIFRKVGNTIQKSTRSQIEWGINKLGLNDYFLIPKSYANPIVYKPTGQQIIFMGMDDPNKVKSIKLPFGYIGITWWEELDQFAGEAELRKALQSTMRGGDKFWDFRTFNPPISKNNWANEYAEIAETRLNSLVMSSTYLDGIPVEWLGEQFFEEANELKEINPRAYEHEYLGIATGTGGDVFQNVQELDMSQLIDLYNGTKIEMYKTFDRLFFGLDFGFTIDPTAFVKCHLDVKKMDLYIFDEFMTHQARNKDIYNELYNKKKLITNNQLLTCDSAEPKSIADFNAYGAFVRGAVKGPDSVDYSMKWLQGLRHIYIDKRRCPNTYKEFIGYEYLTDKQGNFISQYPDKNNHFIDATRYALNNYWTRRGN